ncbi:MAG TPA: sulfate ABC transporter ATP-binding protein [Phycisphaerae bacterium]|jgi:sulfate transport system ATP-binding protein
MSILARNITKRFGTFTALDNLTLQAPGGKLVALLGPSGSGKTTLLRIIAGLEVPDSGQILFEGQDATDRNARHRNVGFVFQHYALFKHMTIFENVAFSLRVRKKPADLIEARVHELLTLVQLDNVAKRYPAQLSGGQRQRVALARALAAEPKVLLLDEPFGALDAKVRKELRRWLRKLHDEIHVTSLFVTHDQEEALEVADQVVIFNKGRIEQVGTPEDVYNKPASPFVVEFLGQVNIFHGRIEPDTAPLAFDDGAMGERTGVGAADADGKLQPAREGKIRAYVRPHEVELLPVMAEAGSVIGGPQEHGGAAEGPGQMAQIVWIHRAGATVKVEVELEGSGQLVVAEMARSRYASLELQRGQRVQVVTREARIFPGDFQI